MLGFNNKRKFLCAAATVCTAAREALSCLPAVVTHYIIPCKMVHKYTLFLSYHHQALRFSALLPQKHDGSIGMNLSMHIIVVVDLSFKIKFRLFIHSVSIVVQVLVPVGVAVFFAFDNFVRFHGLTIARRSRSYFCSL